MFRYANPNAFETRVAKGHQADVMDKVLYVVNEFNDDDMETLSFNVEQLPGIFRHIFCVLYSLQNKKCIHKRW